MLSEVLNTAQEADMQTISKKITEISSNVIAMQREIKEEMEGKYVRLLKQSKTSSYSARVSRATELSENIKEVKKRIDHQTQETSSEVSKKLRSMTEALIEAEVMFSCCEQLLELDQGFKNAFREQKEGHYLAAAVHINRVDELLREHGDNLSFLSIHKAIKEEARRTLDSFSVEALKMWKTKVSWFSFQLDSSPQASSLQIAQSKDLLENLIKTLYIFKTSQLQIEYFSESFFKEILKRCISSKVSVSTKTSGEFVVLSVSSMNEENSPDIDDVVDNLRKVFDFMHQRMDVMINDSENFISELGKLLAEKFLDLFIAEALSEAIPRKRRDLPSFESVVTHVKEFNKYLKTLGFFPDVDNSLDEFCENVEKNFVLKTYERYLVRARDLSKEDLSDKVLIDQANDEALTELPSIDKDTKKESGFHFKEFPEDFGIFPKCHISRTTLELMDLVREVLDDCVSGSHPDPSTPLRLFNTARKCFMLYVEVIPVFHMKLLESQPQLAALYHNNCYYLAHEMIFLNENYRSKYDEQVLLVMGTLIDLVSEIRTYGLEVMNAQLSKQNKLILDAIAGSGLSNLYEDNVPPKLEKSLQQCTEQLTYLDSMWKNVLPVNIYNRLLGILTNTLLEEIINRVCMAKDIQESTALHLVRVFSNLRDSLPQIFDDPNKVHRYVKKWYKFNELIHLLNGSLAEIGDRWADGKGPLGLEFTADQVKLLIKALFQASEKRSAILSRIK